MIAHINEDELKLLTYLHEHAGGYGEKFGLSDKSAMGTIGLDEPAFKKALSYLEEHGLAGHRIDTAGLVWLDYDTYITGLGEDYMRELENAPGIARKLTLRALKQLGNVVLDVAVKVLTEHLKAMAKAHAP